MGNKIDFWVIEEINRLNNEISQRQKLINDFSLAVNEIKKIRGVAIKDYCILTNKYGDIKMHRAVIDCCNKRKYLLKNSVFKNKEEYYSIGVFL